MYRRASFTDYAAGMGGVKSVIILPSRNKRIWLFISGPRRYISDYRNILIRGLAKEACRMFHSMPSRCKLPAASLDIIINKKFRARLFIMRGAGDIIPECYRTAAK